MISPEHGFMFDVNYSFAAEGVFTTYVQQGDNRIPSVGDFLLLDNTSFLLLNDNSNFLLLGQKMSANIEQIFITNPITTIGTTDLIYIGQGGTTDAAITGSNYAKQIQKSSLWQNGISLLIC